MVALLGLALAALPRAPDLGRPLLVHVPTHQAAEGEPVPIIVSATDFDDMGMVELYYRDIGDDNWASLAFARRADGDYEAVIPADDVRPPGVEYYISATDGLAKGDRFASAATPQQVHVAGAAFANVARRDLERFGGDRSELVVQYEYAGFGSPLEEGSFDDRWHRTQVHLDYRLLHAVRQLRFGASILRSDSVQLERAQGETELVPNNGLGMDYGYAAIEVQPHELVGIWGELRLGATENSFSSGGAGYLRLGMDPGTHVVLWGGGMAGYGQQMGMVLHWTTVPRVPMRVEAEASNWPDETAPAVRLAYEARFGLGEHAELRTRVGYQARFHQLGGPTLGAGLVWHW